MHTHTSAPAIVGERCLVCMGKRTRVFLNCSSAIRTRVKLWARPCECVTTHQTNNKNVYTLAHMHGGGQATSRIACARQNTPYIQATVPDVFLVFVVCLLSHLSCLRALSYFATVSRLRVNVCVCVCVCEQTRMSVVYVVYF